MIWTPTGAAWAGAAVTALVALGGFLAFLWRARKRISRMLAAVAAPFTVGQKLDAILMELRPNGGGSLRDAVNRIERENAFQSARMLAAIDREQKPVFEADPTGAWGLANTNLLSLVGKTLPEIRGAGWVNCLDASDRAHGRKATLAEWHAAIAQKRAIEALETRIVMADGQSVTVYLWTKPIEVRGEIVGWSGLLDF